MPVAGLREIERALGQKVDVPQFGLARPHLLEELARAEVGVLDVEAVLFDRARQVAYLGGIALIADRRAVLARNQVIETAGNPGQRIHHAPTVEEHQRGQNAQRIEHQNHERHVVEDAGAPDERRRVADQPPFQPATALGDRLHDRHFGGGVLGAVDDANGLGRVAAFDRGKGLVLDGDEAVRVALGARQQLLLVFGES